MVFVRFRDFLVFVHPSSAKLNHEGVDGSILFRGAKETPCIFLAEHEPESS